jgi:hypothetical protein
MTHCDALHRNLSCRRDAVDAPVKKVVQQFIDHVTADRSKPLSAPDYFTFWANLTSPVFLDSLLTAFEERAAIPNGSSYLAALSSSLFLVLDRMRTSGRTRQVGDYYDRAFRSIPADLLGSNILRLMTLWAEKFVTFTGSDLPCLLALLMSPGLISHPAFFNSVLSGCATVPDFYLILLRWGLQFRTLPADTGSSNIEVILRELLNSRSDPFVRQCIVMWYSELSLPCCHAALSLFDKLNPGADQNVLVSR